MPELKNITPETLLWVDLEMTGLDPARDLIIEVAAIVTDWDFKELGHLEYGVRQDEGELRSLLAQNPFAQARPTETEQGIQTALAGIEPEAAEAEILKLIDTHTQPDEIVLLAGNSIHADRGFIRQYWPRLNRRLHYRMLDVSAWKVVMQGRYNVGFAKKETHRAMDDIRESIDELTHYLELAKFTRHDDA